LCPVCEQLRPLTLMRREPGVGHAEHRAANFHRRSGQKILKKSGGERSLGIPTIADRVAQQVVKVREPELDPKPPLMPDATPPRKQVPSELVPQ